METKSGDVSRIVSLDQFRGYTVLGMFLVNFVGSFAAIKELAPVLCHHHTYFSYADSIMPQFFLAVGFAYRLTFLRRAEASGKASAYRHTLKRNLGLILVGFVVHHLDGRFENWAKLDEVGVGGVLSTAFQRNFFQALTHIGVTSLWIMPVIAARPRWRIGYAVASGVAFHLLSAYGYYGWVLKRPGIDGGPLGFLTWTIPLIAGTLAHDALSATGRFNVGRLFCGGVFLMLLGYGLSCLNQVTPHNSVAGATSWTVYVNEPPFVPPSHPTNIWTMSQRAGSVTYLTFGAGFALAVLSLFVVACDRGPLRIGIFRTLGTNALVGYILHDLVNEAVKPFFPKDSPLWFVLTGFGMSLAICYLFLRSLEKQRLFLKL
jgi:predicted acyltransferase